MDYGTQVIIACFIPVVFMVVSLALAFAWCALTDRA